MIYVWRCDLDANHNPRDTNLEAKMLDPTNIYYKSHVTGLYPKMDGSKISFVLFWIDGANDPYGELRFVEFDFNSGTAKGVLLAKDIHWWFPKTVFHGTNTVSSNGITIY